MIDGVKTVLVVGAGTMGHGIAEVCAISGYRVILVDVSEKALQKATEKIEWSLKKLEKKAKINANDVMSRIQTSTNLAESAKEADLAIEAVVERTDIKKKIFSTLDENCRDEVILATNTSTIPIGEIASATKRPDRVIGLHFFNPPTLIRLIEIVRGDESSDETVEFARKFSKSIGMDFVVVKDVPGFLVNRINARVFTQAVRLLESGYTAEQIDACVKYRLGMPMGIFEVIDFSGVDVLYNVLRELSNRGFDTTIPGILEKMVSENRLGMKTGEGFYKYSGFYGRAEIPKSRAYDVNPLMIIAPAVNEACWIIRNGVASKEDVEKAMKLGMGYRKGILEIADIYGIDRVAEVLKKFSITPDPLLEEMIAENKTGKKSGEGFFRWSHERKTFGPVEYEKRDTYAIIRMKRVEKLNALNEEMWTGIRDALIHAERDREVKAVLITGEGRAFSAGDDIAVMKSWEGIVDGQEFFEKVAGPLIYTLVEYEKPVISLVNGLAFGGGMELNLLMDVVISGRKARFALPEGLIGAFPPIASSVGFFMNRGITRYCITGEEFDAEEAFRLGLVDIVVDDDQLEIAGIELAESISEVAPLSLKAVKKIKNAVFQICRNSLESAVRELIVLSATEDFKEGMKSFAEKRKPVWRGK
ncbi:3-hydroxyacyl-CoA dehydrogenase NAD-binding domain-containing protein [Geoglobus acetivorans]|uniref:3-hydroxyacyl-CoA dehydrogenase/enoyl-CoA hydratase family protein n=1 Tax=Geoglobus acetivorans TaxID=565033 RepID=A0ABZ3H022_GEOAI|nr:3-hydroxyacyl-CoA dehydrogenase/enoyl-CoA hydratase family protein [Geoglobus acetivorans]